MNCQCGCGRDVPIAGKLFLWGHWNRTPEARAKLSRIKTRIFAPSSVLCSCGCGTILVVKNKYHVPRWVLGHHRRGYKLPAAIREKMSRKRMGAGNPMYGKTTSQKQKEVARAYFSGPRNPMRKKENREKVSGPNCHLWRGGITPLNLRIREIYEYREWRRSVFVRDNYTCQSCGKRGGGELHVDHKIPFATLLQRHKIRSEEQARKCVELWDIDNGRTLCLPCHRDTPTFAGRGMKRVHVTLQDA